MGVTMAGRRKNHRHRVGGASLRPHLGPETPCRRLRGVTYITASLSTPSQGQGITRAPSDVGMDSGRFMAISANMGT